MPTLTSTLAGSMLAPFNTAAASGQLKVYAGSVPANADAALGSPTLLGTLTMSATAFAATAHTLTANAITQDSAADASGTASFYRLFQSDGTTLIEQGTVGTSGADLNLNTTAIVAGGPIQVTSFIRTL
ncbi:hypothetical protein [Mesoterricola silvestris]|uniref:Bacteriophage lambda head decoration protein D n=1 Tax=Mesoterricola silvestris TaxID=2927979 RepID=A0AA48GJM6_9BACT|nr:hypothetical protein [Mesoterricola silvestris]BDU72384.1 hypothetical protein METEAL_15580 [Mesoterricola silvestris]